jgi:cytochrome P450
MSIDTEPVSSDRPVVAFNHYAHRSLEESNRSWTALRRSCPVAWTESNGGHWILSDYHSVAAAFKDWETFSSARTDPEVCSLTIAPTRLPPLYPEELDPPAWHPIRRILSELLSPGAVERLRPRIKHWVTYYIDQFIESGRCEIAHDIACPVPAAVILEHLGFPQEEWQRIAGAFHGTGAFARDSREFAQAVADVAWVTSRVAEEVDSRRRAPRDDALSLIARRDLDGRPITKPEAEAVVMLVIGGGVDTTTALISAALIYLAGNPGDRDRLVRDRSLLSTATEEFLRLYPPARTHARTVTRDCEFGNARLAKGDRILLSEVSACHDEGAFPDADRFVIDRFPNRHLAFGLGIHRCVGSHLARAQFKEIMHQVLERLPGYTVEEQLIVEYPNWAAIGGWASIPAVFTPGPRLGVNPGGAATAPSDREGSA